MISLETEINVHVIRCTEHIEIFRIKRLVSLIALVFVLQQTNLFITMFWLLSRFFTSKLKPRV